VKEWLSQCNDHAACSSQRQPFLPTRLLDLNECDTSGEARLVVSKDLDRTTPYVTLSHCWGQNVSFQLRDENIEAMMHGFKVSEMPKTFQDAIAVARWANSKCLPRPQPTSILTTQSPLHLDRLMLYHTRLPQRLVPRSQNYAKGLCKHHFQHLRRPLREQPRRLLHRPPRLQNHTVSLYCPDDRPSFPRPALWPHAISRRIADRQKSMGHPRALLVTQNTALHGRADVLGVCWFIRVRDVS
jgi:hypothetical protein